MIKTIVDGAAAGRYNPNVIRCLYLLHHVNSIAGFPGEAGKLTYNQVINAAMVLLYKIKQELYIGPVEVLGRVAIILKSIYQLHPVILHPVVGYYLLPFYGVMALPVAAEPQVTNSFLHTLLEFVPRRSWKIKLPTFPPPVSA